MTSNSSGDLTVGIVGGMGPYATLDLFRKILEITPVLTETDHLRIIIDNNPRMPSRTRYFLYDENSPVDMMINSVNMLQKSGADFFIFPCNSAHYFIPEILQHVSIPFLSMIEETCKVVLKRNAKIVGILAGEVTVRAKLYEEFLSENGIKIVHVSDKQQILVRNIIEDVKNNCQSDITKNTFHGLIMDFHSKGVDTVILACTELPLVLTEISVQVDIIDSLSCLAYATVAKAKKIDLDLKQPTKNDTAC